MTYPQLAYYYQHREYKLEYQKKYYQSNKDNISKYYKNYYKKRKTGRTTKRQDTEPKKPLIQFGEFLVTFD